MMFYWTLLVALFACDVFPLSLATHCVCDCSKCFLGNNTKITREPRMDDRFPRSTDVNQPHFVQLSETHDQTSQLYNTSVVSKPDHLAPRSLGPKAKSVPSKSTPTKAKPPKVRKLARRGKTKKQRMMEQKEKTTQSPPATRNLATALDNKISTNLTEREKPSPPKDTTKDTKPKTKLRKGEASQELKDLVNLVSNTISQSLLEEQETLAKEGVTNERLSRARLQMAAFKTVKQLDKPLEDIGRLSGDSETAVKVIEKAVANNPIFRQVNSDSKDVSPRSGHSSIANLSPSTKDYITMIMS